MSTTVSGQSPNRPSPSQPLEPGTQLRVDGAHESLQPSTHGMRGTVTGVQILSTASHAPDHVVRNEDLVELGYDPDWIVQRTGIRERRRGEEGYSTSDMSLPAARACLEQAGVTPTELDLILVGTMTPDHPTPSAACNLQQQLGAVCPALDVNAACAGFMYALVVGMQFVAADPTRKILVIGADMVSRAMNPADRKTFPLFGDGAGAVLLGKGTDRQGLLRYFLGAQGDGGQYLCQPAGGSRETLTPERYAAGRQYVRMDGKAVFRWAVRIVVESSRRVLEESGFTIDDMDQVIFHQANIRIIDSAVDSLGVPRDKVFINVDRYGNTSAGSIPLALDEAVREGRVQRGNRVLLVGFGAGLAWGAGVLQW